MKSALVLMFILTFAPIYWMQQDQEPLYSIITYLTIMLLTLLFMLHLVFTTYYTFEGDQLICRAGFFRKEIDIASIRKIETGSQWYAGWKMALALKGIIVHYGRWDDVLISPEDQDAFIAELTGRNRSIEVKSS